MIRIISLGLFFAWALSAGFSVRAVEEIVVEDDLVSGDDTFQEHCALCHGEQMQGAPQGTLLVGQPLVHGDSMQSLTASIANGFPDKGMRAWA
ncbi:MAG: cytochrome c [Proteobacteria bacterium]|nr:cytochrome c [Pseudomonadota bacterium]